MTARDQLVSLAWRPLRSPQFRSWLRKRLTTVSNSPSPVVRRAYVVGRQTARRAARRLTGRQVGWVGMVRSARWTGPTTFTFSGWAYERGFGYPDGAPRTRVWFQSGSLRVEADVEQLVDQEANAGITNPAYDYANTGFRATVDVAELHAHLPARAGQQRTWQAFVQVVGRDGTRRSGRFAARDRLGSPRHLSTRTLDDGSQVVPAFDARTRGLTLTTRVPVVVARDLTIADRHLSGTFVSAVELVDARVVTDGVDADLALSPVGDASSDGLRRYSVDGEVPAERPETEVPDTRLSVTRTLVAVAADDRRHTVASDLDDAAPEVFPGTTLMIASSPAGHVALLDAPGRVLVDGWTVEPGDVPHLRLHGRYAVSPSSVGTVPRVEFVGNRQVLGLDPEIVRGGDGQGSWSGTVPLHVPEWGRQPLPPRQGTYVLRTSLSDGTVVPVSAVPEVSAGTPEVHALDGFRLVRQSGGGRSVRFKVSPPRRPDELGSFHQRRLEAAYLGRPHGTEDAVYFESFYGRGATCNPRAIDAEVARTRPELTRYWGVVDAATPVPEGAVAVVRGTREWWEARARARWVVANDWLRRQFEPQPFQVVLQTWHGSMLKRIGLDRPKVPAEKRRIIDVERAKWDLLLSQNLHSTDILRSAYAWEGPILEEGYPRNDPLTPGSTQAGDGAAIRAALGILPGQRAVLYAPTWRENLTEMVAFLDLERLAADLGPDHVILLRGHSRTVAFGASVSIPGVIDVTTYPEVTDLFLAADALITDYSSVMFDYSVTRRPMIFFVPDMDAYRDSLRGVYFDLSEVAPGPVLADQDGVTEAVLALDRAGERYAEPYERWVERFNHHDDGRSAERVTARLLAFEK